MIIYKFYSSIGNGESSVKFDLDKIKEYYQLYDEGLSDALIAYAIDYGKSKSDISPNAGDFDPYKTEVFVSEKEYEILKKEFPDADNSEWTFIKTC